MSKRIERPGIKLVGMPGPVVAHALRSPLTQRLVITDAGCYPNAVGHHTIREQGIPETIVVICTKGVGWLRIGKEKHRISTHEVYVVSAGVPHEYWADADDPWTTWWVHITGTDVPELVRAIGTTEAKPVVPIHSTARAIALLNEILTAFETAPSPIRMLSATAAAWKLLRQIAVDHGLPKPGAPHQRAFTCLEGFSSGTGIAKRYNRRTGQTLAGAREVIETGDDISRQVLASAGLALGAAIGSVVSLLDPEVVVLGGGLGCGNATMIEQIRIGYAQRANERPNPPALLTAKCGSGAGVIDAAVGALNLLEID